MELQPFELKCLGMKCPLPIIHLAREIANHSQVLLSSDDPATEADLSAWARMTGNSFEVIGPNRFLVKQGFTTPSLD